MRNSKAIIEVLTERIAFAYGRLHPKLTSPSATISASLLAASTLLKAHLDDDSIPLDPELFVRAQAKRSTLDDPWFSLAHASAMRAYKRLVKKIVRSLREELVSEIVHADNKIASGDPVFQVLTNPDRKLSPLTRFLLAHRHGRKTLALRFLHDAVEQHQACPLYRMATAGLLPSNLYPDEVYVAERYLQGRIDSLRQQGANQPQWN